MNSKTIAAYLVTLGFAIFAYAGIISTTSTHPGVDTAHILFISLSFGAIALASGIALVLAESLNIRERVRQRTEHTISNDAGDENKS